MNSKVDSKSMQVNLSRPLLRCSMLMIKTFYYTSMFLYKKKCLTIQVGYMVFFLEVEDGKVSYDYRDLYIACELLGGTLKYCQMHHSPMGKVSLSAQAHGLSC